MLPFVTLSIQIVMSQSNNPVSIANHHVSSTNSCNKQRPPLVPMNKRKNVLNNKNHKKRNVKSTLPTETAQTPSSLSSTNSLLSNNSSSTTTNGNGRRSAFRCRFYVNGDRHFNGFNFVINLDRLRTLDSLCRELSRLLVDMKSLPSGVRIIFNMDDGQKICSMKQFRHNHSYVCSSNEHFIRLDYHFGAPAPASGSGGSSSRSTPDSGNIQDNSTRPSAKSLIMMDNDHQYRSIRHCANQSTTSSAKPNSGGAVCSLTTTQNVNIMRPKLVALLRGSCRGSEPHMRPSRRVFRFLINHRIAQNYEQLLNEISKSVKLNVGAVHRLYGLSSSKKITCLNDIYDDECVYLVYGRSEKCQLSDFLLDEYEQREIASIVGGSYLTLYYMNEEEEEEENDDNDHVKRHSPGLEYLEDNNSELEEDRHFHSQCLPPLDSNSNCLLGPSTRNIRSAPAADRKSVRYDYRTKTDDKKKQTNDVPNSTSAQRNRKTNGQEKIITPTNRRRCQSTPNPNRTKNNSSRNPAATPQQVMPSTNDPPIKQQRFKLNLNAHRTHSLPRNFHSQTNNENDKPLKIKIMANDQHEDNIDDNEPEEMYSSSNDDYSLSRTTANAHSNEENNNSQSVSLMLDTPHTEIDHKQSSETPPNRHHSSSSIDSATGDDIVSSSLSSSNHGHDHENDQKQSKQFSIKHNTIHNLVLDKQQQLIEESSMSPTDCANLAYFQQSTTTSSPATTGTTTNCSTPGGASSISCSDDFSFDLSSSMDNSAAKKLINKTMASNEIQHDDDDDSYSSLSKNAPTPTPSNQNAHIEPAIELESIGDQVDQEEEEDKIETIDNNIVLSATTNTTTKPVVKIIQPTFVTGNRPVPASPATPYSSSRSSNGSSSTVASSKTLAAGVAINHRRRRLNPMQQNRKYNPNEHRPRRPPPAPQPTSPAKILPMAAKPTVLPPISPMQSPVHRSISNRQSNSAQSSPRRSPARQPPPVLHQIPAATKFQPKKEVDELYFVDKSIGDGKFGVVYTCIHRQTRQSYAMKVVDKYTMQQVLPNIANRSGNGTSSLNSEVAILTKVNHPNIVRLYDHFDYVDQCYLVLELLQGGDLFDAITVATRYKEPEAALMIYDLLNALNYLHSLNIVHRDIKLENLLVSYVPIHPTENETSLMESPSRRRFSNHHHHHPQYRRQIKLADFGLAIQIKPNEKLYTVCGTPTYVAPEILLEIGYSFPVDIWAAGVILYILLSGLPPFINEENDQVRLFDQIISGRFDFYGSPWRTVSEQAKRIIQQMLCVEQSNRVNAQQLLNCQWLAQFQINSENVNNNNNNNDCWPNPGTRDETM